MSLGADVKQKLQNMVRWVAEHAQKPELAASFIVAIKRVSEMSEMAAMMYAQQIADTLDGESFEVLLASEIPSEVSTALSEVIVPNADMHDKFWRYMRYFKEATSA